MLGETASCGSTHSHRTRLKSPEMPGPCVGTKKWCSQRPLPRAALNRVPQKRTRVSTGNTAAQHCEMLECPPRRPHPSFNPLAPCLPRHWNMSCLRAGPCPPCSSVYAQGPAQRLNLKALKKSLPSGCIKSSTGSLSQSTPPHNCGLCFNLITFIS